MRRTKLDNPNDRPGAIPTDRLREWAVWGASRVALALHKLYRRPRTSGFGILMYHRVARPTPGLPAPTYSVTPEQLHAQLAGLLERGYEPWPLAKALAWHTAGRPVPANAFVVTFDDGYENNLTAALPVLQQLGVPATIFLATAFLDSDEAFPSDDWGLAGSSQVPAENWRPLTTDECEQLLASGIIELGAHTHTHGFFAGRVEDFREDMLACLAVLENRFGLDHPPLAFPFGITSPELVAVAQELGLSCALTTRFENVTADSDPFDWGRFNVTGSDSAAIIAAKLAGWYAPVAAAIRAVKQPLGNLVRRRPNVAASSYRPVDGNPRPAVAPSFEEVGRP